MERALCAALQLGERGCFIRVTAGCDNDVGRDGDELLDEFEADAAVCAKGGGG